MPKTSKFENRARAGEALAEKLEYKNAVVLAIPRGGIPVAIPVARKLDAPLFVFVTRKLPVPSSPEVGFGAITSDKVRVLNEELVAYAGISKKQVEEISKEVLKEVKRREKVYSLGKGFPNLKNKTAVIVDDGLATGFTAIAAAKHAKKHGAKKVVVATPTSSVSAFEELKKKTGCEIVCLVIDPYFQAVAQYYEDFHEMTDEEVVGLLKELFQR
ncbi:MAG: phosphoribosyltransferase [Candidatus Micrarchaeia archaeon]